MAKCFRFFTVSVVMLFVAGFVPVEAKWNDYTCIPRRFVSFDGSEAILSAVFPSFGFFFSKKPEPESELGADTEKYVQVIRGPTKILAELRPESPILGIVSKGRHYPLLLAGDSWCKIQYGDTPGWIERRYVRIVDAPSSIILSDFLKLLAIVAGIVLLILVVRFFIMRANKVRSGWIKSTTVEMRILIIAKNDKIIARYLSDSGASLQKCFAEVGFSVSTVRNSDDVGKTLIHNLPDVVAVDWEFGPTIQYDLERLIAAKANAANVLVIFYNVPEPDLIQKSRVIPNAKYLGISFTDREVFSLVTPLLMSEEQPREIRKSVEVAALEGEIGDGSLPEVLQFVEIGHKTGCLLVEDRKPSGLVYFKDGTIVYAVSGRARGKDAVFELLAMESGKFRFVLDKEAPATNCTLPTLGVLMEWTKELDEAPRY